MEAQEQARLTRKFRILARTGGLLGAIGGVVSAIIDGCGLQSETGFCLVVWAMFFLAGLVWFLTSAFIVLSAAYPAFRWAWVMLANMTAGLLQIFGLGWLVSVLGERGSHLPRDEASFFLVCLVACFPWIIISTKLVASAFVTSETLRKMQEG